MYSVFVNHDGWKSEREEGWSWVADREEVCPTLPRYISPLARLQSGRRVCQEVCSALARVPPLLHCHCYCTTYNVRTELRAAGERSSRPAELHRQCSVLCRPSEAVDSLEAAAAAAACQPRRSRPRPAAVRTRASTWEEKESVQDRTLTVPEQSRSLRLEPP